MTLERLEGVALTLVLAAAVAFSLAGNLFQIPTDWQMPLIFLALYYIIRILLRSEREPTVQVEYHGSGKVRFQLVSSSLAGRSGSHAWCRRA